MKVVGLVSGGKDSVYNMLQCIAAGHDVVAIANIEPKEKRDELDSFMYQTVGHQVLTLMAGAMALPIFRQRTDGLSICKEKIYVQTHGDEVEDLFSLLAKVKAEAHIEGVSVGAIASDYQRSRVENVCGRLNLKCLAYLWRQPQDELLNQMIEAEVNAIIIKVASMGLNPNTHLGMTIADLKPVVTELNSKFGVNICGEGGEYETLTLDCPLFHKVITILESNTVVVSDDAFAPVAYLNVTNANVENKNWGSVNPLHTFEQRIAKIKSVVKKPLDYVLDCLDEVPEKDRSSFVSQKSNDTEAISLVSKSSLVSHQDSMRSTVLSENSKLFSQAAFSQTSHSSHPGHTVTFSPSTLSAIDTTITQLNHSSGWCYIGNVTAPSVKEGLAILKKHLERHQYELSDLVSVTLYIRNMNDFAQINKTYSQVIPGYLPPVRACVATHLPPDIGIILGVIAHRVISKMQKTFNHTVGREVIHVQSISHWAPANIGPYSQSVKVGEIVYLAGQIPLVPGSMEILNESISRQCRLALRHVLRILQAAKEDFTFQNVFQALCYVTTETAAVEVVRIWNYFTKNLHATLLVLVVSSLPRNAEIEWQAVACGFENPQFSTSSEMIGDFRVKSARCWYSVQLTGSVVTQICHTKKSKKAVKASKCFDSEVIISFVRHCFQYLRGEFPGQPLCNLYVFYKFNDSMLASAINDAVKSSHVFKVVITCVPVISYEESNVFLAISGVCH